MPTRYIVRARDLKPEGVRIAQGAFYTPSSERYEKRAQLLTTLKPPALELAPKAAPVRKVASVTTRQLESEPAAPAAAAPPAKPDEERTSGGTYRNRRLTSEE